MREVFSCTAFGRTALMLMAPLLFVACASSDFGTDQNIRSPEDAPNRFMVGEINEEATRAATAVRVVEARWLILGTEPVFNWFVPVGIKVITAFPTGSTGQTRVNC